MSKKVLMHFIFIITVILFLVNCFMNFSQRNLEAIYSDKTQLSIRKPEEMEKKDYVHCIMKISEELSADVMYERVNGDLEYEYYKTNINEDFLKLSTSKNSCMLEGNEMLSTHDREDAGKIYGFSVLGDDIHIFPFEKIEELDLDTGNYLVETKHLDAFVAKLDEQGIESEKQATMQIVDGSGFYISILFGVFLVIAIVFYAFSRGKEFVVKRTLGYRNIDVCASELKTNLVLFVIEILCLTGLIFIVCSIIFDVPSTILFLKEMIKVVTPCLFVTLVVLLVSVWGVVARISAKSIKGYNNNKELYIVTTIFKLILSVICLVVLSQTCKMIFDTYQMYSATKSTVEKVDGYAKTKLNVFVETPESNPEEYGRRMEELYRLLYEKQGLILISASGADEPVDEMNPYGLHTITVNDHYIDASNDIYLTDGTKLTSDVLEQGKQNLLVPEGYDTTILVQRNCKYYDIEPEEVHCIEYSLDSKFFTYSNEVAPENNGYVSDVIVKVFDLEYQTEIVSEYNMGCIFIDYFTDELIFEYDVESDKSPYEQIKNDIEECQLNNIIIETPTLKDVYNENLKYYYQMILYQIINLVVVLFSFIVLLFYASELYYLNNAKDISVKQINGYSFLNIFQKIYIAKCCIMIVYSVASFVLPISFGIACLMVLFEIMIFSLVMKKQSKNNIVSIIKGEV